MGTALCTPRLSLLFLVMAATTALCTIMPPLWAQQPAGAAGGIAERRAAGTSGSWQHRPEAAAPAAAAAAGGLGLGLGGLGGLAARPASAIAVGQGNGSGPPSGRSWRGAA